MGNAVNGEAPEILSDCVPPNNSHEGSPCQSERRSHFSFSARLLRSRAFPPALLCAPTIVVIISGTEKNPVSPLSPSRQVSLSVASLRLPTELAPSPAPLGLCRAFPAARLCHGSGLAPQGCPRPSPAAGGFLSRSDSLKQSENLRTNEVEASDRLTTSVQSAASGCRGLAESGSKASECGGDRRAG